MLVAAAGALLSPGLAGAGSTPTRDEFVDRAEAICKTETENHEGVLDGVEAMTKAGRLAAAAGRVQGAAAALREAVSELAATPRPPADAARISRWLTLAKRSNGLLGEMAAALREGKRDRAQRLARQLLAETKRANAVVVGFQFYYCRLNPARFV
jgi:hypothetical protein